jgi:hypothetical protein
VAATGENEEAWWNRCARLEADDDWTVHYYEHMQDKTKKEDTEEWKDAVDIYTMGVGENARIKGDTPTMATVVTPKGKKDTPNRRCMIYFPSTFGESQPKFLMGRYAKEADINMISVTYNPGPTGFINAVSIVRDIGLNYKRFGCHAQGVGLMGEGLGGYISSKVALFKDNADLHPGKYIQFQVLISPYVGRPDSALSPSMNEIETDYNSKGFWDSPWDALGESSDK